MGLKINLGCGTNIRPASNGWINVDKRFHHGVDVVHDVTVIPWPLESGSAELIVAECLFEHIPDLVSVLNECWRVLEHNGTLWCNGPLPDSPFLWLDITHVRAFVEHCFDHFDPDTELGWHFQYYPPTFHVVEEKRSGSMIEFTLKAVKE